MSKIEFPKTIEEIELIQPNNVTFGQYSLDAVQENVMTLIADGLQSHMTKTKELPRDLFNQPYVEIICNEALTGKNKTYVKQRVREMADKWFRFKWVHPNMGKEIETEGKIITSMHDVKGTDRLIINFNAWSIPFLVYYGIGVGGTEFNKAIALSLRGEYVKRVYKMVCRWKDRATFEYSIEQFKLDLEIPATYDNTKIESAILKVAEKKIKESGSSVWFGYELICKNPIKGRKPKADTIIFIVHNDNLQQVAPEVFAKYKAVYDFLALMWNANKSNKAMETVDLLKDLGVIEKVHGRVAYYQQKVFEEKTMPLLKAQNSLKKMLRDEYKIETETQEERTKREKRLKGEK